MAPLDSSPSPAAHLLGWQLEYEAVLSETDTSALFTRVEVAEAALLTRRDALQSMTGHRSERQALAEALANLGFIKRKRLKFL